MTTMEDVKQQGPTIEDVPASKLLNYVVKADIVKMLTPSVDSWLRNQMFWKETKSSGKEPAMWTPQLTETRAVLARNKMLSQSSTHGREMRTRHPGEMLLGPGQGQVQGMQAASRGL